METAESKLIQNDLARCREEFEIQKEKTKDAEEFLQSLHYSIDSLIFSLAAQPDLFLSLLVALACSFVEARTGSLLEPDEENKEWKLAAKKGLPGDYSSEKYDLDKGLLDRTAQKRQLLFAEDSRGQFFIIPLVLRDRTVGLLTISQKEGGGSFTVKDKKFLSLFAGPAAVILENFHLYQKSQGEIADLKIKTEELGQARKAVVNILEDVDEARKTAETEKNKTLSVISNLADGLLVFNETGRLSLANRQAEKLLNIKAGSIAGRDLPELKTVPGIKPLIVLLESQKGEIFRKELVLGNDLIIEVSRIKLAGGQGAPPMHLVVLHDVTREKIIERTKTEFVSLSAHQLRTPLSAIKWSLKMLLEGDAGKITAEQKEFIGKAYLSNERMINLVSDLLDITRIEEGRYVYKPKRGSLENVIESAVDLMAGEIEKKKIIFDFQKSEKRLPAIMMDAEKMELAIQNLLENSIRYTAEGGKIEIALTADKNEIKFLIKDTGVGISKDQQSRIFTKFFRGSNVIRMETEGTGLGLFITKNIIEAHGGKIWFESKEGGGSTFYFVLPI